MAQLENEGVVQPRKGIVIAARGGLDPEAELADLDGLGVEVHAVELVLENLPVCNAANYFVGAEPGRRRIGSWK